ncbi:hypothetical protein KRE47_17465 [Elizabethkingia meningoseptica]|uniref:bacteriocin-like protein n=1 Tax=Elizabethkingia meningoseptica TaxID=238 RepID=UPI0015937531|nr:hypothetical protein [Elizabethkingia meningoseptica]MDE5469565.1 hypothetical protein [Elizabethkingia meningoseptica]MDE5480170.1 hypothetical protein [Elizabethkingia meningoseptica]MDE5487236.1 hypothetical protein [Elizabethkingia meningoseptica]MDE5503574.1 hypothetical protein [Elizabethkingia meningoseptica]MDE5506753.1 hypothetical protein [Elizabethkingia meningoseptica]
MKNLNKITRANLKKITGAGEPLPEGWGVCFIKGQPTPTPCNQPCPNGTDPICPLWN